MKLYVVTCFVEGCEECGNSYGVVGAYSTKEKAESAEKNHGRARHLHSSNTNVAEIELDADTTQAGDYCRAK